MSINPIAFLVVQNSIVKLLPVSYSSTLEKLLDYVPDLLDKTNTVLNKTIDEIIDDQKDKKVKTTRKNTEASSAVVPEEKVKPKREKTIVKEKPEEAEYEYEYTEEDILDDE